MSTTQITPSTAGQVTPAKPRFTFNTTERFRENLAGWAFVSPAVLLIFIFGIFPIGFAAYMSLYRWRIRQSTSFCEANAPEGGVTGIGSAVQYVRGCLQHYESSIIGDWGGVAIFVIGFGVLLSGHFIWNTKFWTRFDGFAGWVARSFVTLSVIAVSFAIISQGYMQMTGALRARDRDFLESLQITFYYAIGSIPLQLALGLVLAYVLHSNIRGKQTFRMIFFLPYVTPTVAAAVVFGTIFSGRTTSLANQFLTAMGLDTQRWLNESRPFINVMFGLELEGFIAGPSMALVAVIILGIWTYTGYNAVLFMAGLGNIPTDLYEAARVDGASEWHLFRYITLPLISPVTFYLSIIGFIGTFTAFNTLFVMRTNAALGTMDTTALVIFDTFRQQDNWGEAAAMAIVLMLIVLALTQVQRSLFEKRVFYG